MNIADFQKKKLLNEKITVLTCYDYPSAKMVANTSLDAVLVGDSLAMAVHGLDSTVMATLDMMVLHTKAVARGLNKQFLISDLPFMCHRLSLRDALLSVQQLMQAGAHAVKIEGGDQDCCHVIEKTVQAGVPVMGHIGLTPQYLHQLGGYRVQGRDDIAANRLIQEAKRLEAAGCFALVLECIPHTLAKEISTSLSIPTIGIGAGKDTDGQVLVWHDVLGLHDFNAKFLKQYMPGQTLITSEITRYVQDVREGLFPEPSHCFD